MGKISLNGVERLTEILSEQLLQIKIRPPNGIEISYLH